MNDLLDFINHKTNNKYKCLNICDMSFSNKNNKLFLDIIYPDEMNNIMISDRKIINDAISSFFENKISIKTKYTKNYIDKPVIVNKIIEYINNNQPSIMSIFNGHIERLDFKKDSYNISIEMYYIEGMLDPKNIDKFSKDLVTYLNKNNCYTFYIKFKKVKDEENKISDEKINDVDSYNNIEQGHQPIKVELVKQLIGAKTTLYPKSPSDIKISDNVSVVGKIKYLRKKEYVSKYNKEPKNSDESIKKTYITFVLELMGSEISCVYFPTAKTINKISYIENNMEVIIGGEYREKNSSRSFLIKELSHVKILETPDDNIYYKKSNKEYINIQPEAYIDYEQASIFEMDKKHCDYIMNNSFVVFDFETTGLNYSQNKIIEIGAVKIVKGKIIDKFSTFINPEENIPLEITGITGIDDNMVNGAPLIKAIIPDFYKYCEGSILMAYNISFDYGFLNHNSLKYGYKFDNDQMDVLYMARKYLHNLKNYKLKTVCEELNISLSNAHRAYYDAAATAKVFIKLAENIK